MVQGAEALPRIQPAHGWAGIPQGAGTLLWSWCRARKPDAGMAREGGKAPFRLRLQPEHSWEGVEGSGSAPFVGAWGQRSRRTANEVCVSAPFGLSVHTFGAGMGNRKIEMRFSLYSL